MFCLWSWSSGMAYCSLLVVCFTVLVCARIKACHSSQAATIKCLLSQLHILLFSSYLIRATSSHSPGGDWHLLDAYWKCIIMKFHWHLSPMQCMASTAYSQVYIYLDTDSFHTFGSVCHNNIIKIKQSRWNWSADFKAVEQNENIKCLGVTTIFNNSPHFQGLKCNWTNKYNYW